jgi:hypothetical protein
MLAEHFSRGVKGFLGVVGKVFPLLGSIFQPCQMYVPTAQVIGSGTTDLPVFSMIKPELGRRLKCWRESVVLSDGGPDALPLTIRTFLKSDAGVNTLLGKEQLLIGKVGGKREGYERGITIFLKPRIASEKAVIGEELPEGG